VVIQSALPEKPGLSVRILLQDQFDILKIILFLATHV
jgi:hypothetical protein